MVFTTRKISSVASAALLTCDPALPCKRQGHLHPPLHALVTMEDVPMTPVEPVGFPVPSLRGISSYRIVFKELPQRLGRMPECEGMSRRLHERIRATHDAVAAHDEQWKAEYCDVLKRLVKLLRRTPLLERLAGGETIAYTFREFNAKMDRVSIGVGVIDASAQGQWQADWANDCQTQAALLERQVRATAPASLIGQMNGEKTVIKAMLDMSLSIEDKTPGPLAGLKRATLERLRAHLRLETRVITAQTLAAGEANANGIVSVFLWYIPERDVEITNGPLIGAGSYGTVNHGTWRDRRGVVHDVIVKSLHDQSSESEASFLRQLQFWYELPKHPNIIRLFGGSHLAERRFFVCEDAPGGDIVQFLGNEENRGMLWSLFLQVAEGLKVLHDHHIVHDGLRGSNILIGENSTPKISDFDCSRIRAISQSYSQQTEEKMASSVRWKPRERMVETSSDTPHYKSDIYSLGMCIIEAMAQDIPFGTEIDDSDVTEKIIAREPYERPKTSMSDGEWSVISRLIVVDMNERPDINEVIGLLRSLVPPNAA
ncbi:Serine/threonine protein kinase [Phytophthora cinnamomi]|uniref:Serine/threonine protein kinase n=1 Tax=Phytophthora cinnamomi TaxID=4785 RepID=UPI00355A9326|nr:Serine/threonine protein kinase [Phytophthora cinnamomi]